ncbi:MAG: YihY/virulence factor BrkB family protein [Candidatus Zixiibacteriota bacterium]
MTRKLNMRIAAKWRAFKKNFSWRGFKDWWGHYLGGLYHHVDEHHIFLMSGGLTFSLFVCIVPLTLVLYYMVGILSEKFFIANEFDSFIDGVIPYQAYAMYIKDLVAGRVQEFKAYKNVIGLIGLVGLFLAASTLFSSMRTILNAVYKVKHTQPVVIGKLRDIGLVLAVLLYFLLSTIILPTLTIIKKFALKFELLENLKSGVLEYFMVSGVSFLIIFTSFFILYLLIPQKKIPRRIIFVSALSASVLWEMAKYLFGLYIANVATLTKVYGAYALIVVVGFWVYYMSIVFIVGAEIGQLSWERHRKSVYMEESIISDQYLEKK